MWNDMRIPWNSAMQNSTLLANQDNKCYYCNEEMDGKNWNSKSVTVDHFIPKSAMQTGINHFDIGNIVLACRACNGLKASIIPGAYECGDSYSIDEDWMYIKEWETLFKKEEDG